MVNGAANPIGDYAFLSDMRTGALVSREGDIDWYCPHRFDEPALFSAILGDPKHGQWALRIQGGQVESRAYEGDSLVVQTQWTADDGTATVRDGFGPGKTHSLIRHVECTSGTVTVQTDLTMRFNYGTSVPWVTRQYRAPGEVMVVMAGSQACILRGPELTDRNMRHGGDFTLNEGESLVWSLEWFPSYKPVPLNADPLYMLHQGGQESRQWAAKHLDDDLPALVRRSLLTLRALTHEETGGIAAALTTSLPETIGGERNWDYRYTWLRDSALATQTMADYGTGVAAWRDWLLRAIAGNQHDLQIMYNIDGGLVPDERELDLPGYMDSQPVRTGNGAAHQFQGDVIGEVLHALHHLRETGVKESHESWRLQRALLEYQTANLHTKGQGLWEMRGEPKFHTHSRAMMWAAYDRAITACEVYGLEGPVEQWCRLRDMLREEINEKGFNREVNSFVQTYGSTEVDAALLQLPMIGFVDADDPRMLGTVDRIEDHLIDESGFLHRYRTGTGVDGLDGDEAPFMICGFWLVEQYASSGRTEDALRVFENLCSAANELGLLAEEYDPKRKLQLGNFPQAFSHLGLVEAYEVLWHRTDKQTAARAREIADRNINIDEFPEPPEPQPH